jgi:hypothetical protein
MWAKASIFRIGPFWPPRRTRTLVVDDGRVLTLYEPAVIDEALPLGDKLGGAANLQQQRDATITVADDRWDDREGPGRTRSTPTAHPQSSRRSTDELRARSSSIATLRPLGVRRAAAFVASMSRN